MVELAEGEHQLCSSVSTAWLLLSHGGFLGAVIGAGAIATTLALFSYALSQRWHVLKRPIQYLSISWYVGSILITLWTLFAIVTTWLADLELPNPIFGSFGFAFLFVIVLFLGTLNAILMYIDIQFLPYHPDAASLAMNEPSSYSQQSNQVRRRRRFTTAPVDVDDFVLLDAQVP